MNEHIATIRKDEDFKKGTFFREPRSENGRSYDEIYGTLKSGSIAVQSIRFPSSEWAEEEAVAFKPSIAFTSAESENGMPVEEPLEDEEKKKKEEEEEDKEEEPSAGGEEDSDPMMESYPEEEPE